MAASKRIVAETGSDLDQNPNEKRLRPSLSFHSVIIESMRVRRSQSFREALESLLRKVVSEEVDRAIRHKVFTLSRSPSHRLEAPTNQQEPSNLKLVFAKQLSLPIFTGSKIHDCDNNPLRILLVREQNGQTVQETLPHPIKIELVAIDGDFCSERGSWSTEGFKSNILKERHGRRPLLAGELVYTMKVADGFVTVGDVEFTDNSSWVRGRKFRVGARVVEEASHSVVGILPAVSEPFNVRDHRGELYKKHYPPNLNDEVWRLEKIGKDGTFHQKLVDNGIKTVQDFLKLSNVNPTLLRQEILKGMSDKMWEVTVKHAKTCVRGNKCYVLRGQNYVLALNPTCEVNWANINGAYYFPSQDCTISPKAYIERLVKLAYDEWDSLEELVEGPSTTPIPQLLGPSQMMMDQTYNWEAQMQIQRQYMGQEAQHENGLMTDGPAEVDPLFITTNVEMGCAYFPGSDTSFGNLPNSN